MCMPPNPFYRDMIDRNLREACGVVIDQLKEENAALKARIKELEQVISVQDAIAVLNRDIDIDDGA